MHATTKSSPAASPAVTLAVCLAQHVFEAAYAGRWRRGAAHGLATGSGLLVGTDPRVPGRDGFHLETVSSEFAAVWM